MKALLCEKLGHPSDLVIKEVDTPEPQPQEVLIQMKACALNFPDLLKVQGMYQDRPDLPFTVGSDIAGVITAVGSEVTKYKVGDEVFGLVMNGGLAEYAVAHQHMVYPKPPEIGFDMAASFLFTYGTSYHALFDRANLQKDEWVVVLGASGGVGTAAVDLALHQGAKVIACASTEEKLAVCKSLGAHETINYETEDLRGQIKALTNGKGANVIYDPVGGKYAEPAFRTLAWGGRYLVIGFAAGNIPSLPFNLPLLKGSSIVGAYFGRSITENPRKFAANNMHIIQMIQSGALRPQISKMGPLEDTSKMLEAMMNRKLKGKAVVVF